MIITGTQAQHILKNKLSVEAMKKAWETIKHTDIVVSESDLHEVRWLWEASVGKLMEAGINSQKELKAKTEEEVREIIKNPLTIKNILTFINNSF